MRNIVSLMLAGSPGAAGDVGHAGAQEANRGIRLRLCHGARRHRGDLRPGHRRRQRRLGPAGLDLVKDGTYSVIERSALDRILREQNFSNSDRANPTSAARIGKLLGVDAIIVGSITQFGNETKQTGLGGAAATGQLRRRRLLAQEEKAVVGLTARIVDIDTGEILAWRTARVS